MGSEQNSAANLARLTGRGPQAGPDIGEAFKRLHPIADDSDSELRDTMTGQCEACGAPVDAAGRYVDEDAQAQQLTAQARAKMKEDPDLSFGDAVRLVNGERSARAEMAAQAIRSGLAPAQQRRTDALDKATRRVMRDTGADYGTALRRVLSENVAIARAYREG